MRFSWRPDRTGRRGWSIPQSRKGARPDHINVCAVHPLSLITFISAAGVRRGERWAWRIAIISALTVLALPCTIMATMGLQYFAGAPLFLAGALSVTAAGVFMLLALLLARRDLARNG